MAEKDRIRKKTSTFGRSSDDVIGNAVDVPGSDELMQSMIGFPASSKSNPQIDRLQEKINLLTEDNQALRDYTADLEQRLAQSLETAVNEVTPSKSLVPFEGGRLYDGCFYLTATGLQIVQEVTPEQWQDMGHVLKQIDSALNWWIGDWADMRITPNMNQHERNTIYLKIAQDFGFESDTIKNCTYVCRAIDASLRNDALDWSHHYLVAKYNPDMQLLHLQHAEKNGLSVRDFKDYLRGDRPTPLPETDTKWLKTAFDRTFKAFSRGNVGQINRDDLESLRAWIDRVERELGE